MAKSPDPVLSSYIAIGVMLHAIVVEVNGFYIALIVFSYIILPTSGEKYNPISASVAMMIFKTRSLFTMNPPLLSITANKKGDKVSPNNIMCLLFRH